MKKRFNLIIFDWGVTLINSIDRIVHCLQKSAERCHCDIPGRQAAKDVIGLSIDNAIETQFPGADHPIRKHFATIPAVGVFAATGGITELY